MRLTSPLRRALPSGACAFVAIALAILVAQLAECSAATAGDDKVAVAFMGDSMVDGLWGGFARLVSKESCLASKIKLLRFGENGTGLTRPVKFDWIREAQTIVQTQKPTITVISIGLNDRQSIVDAQRKRFDLGTPGWHTRYGELAASFAKSAATSPGGVLWLGIPALRDPVAQQDAAEKNEIVAKALAALQDPRISFLEAWHQGGAATDTFKSYGEGVGGGNVQLRAADGVHFTSVGYDVVARYVFPKVVEQLKLNKIDLKASCGT